MRWDCKCCVELLATLCVGDKLVSFCVGVTVWHRLRRIALEHLALFEIRRELRRHVQLPHKQDNSSEARR